MQWGGEGEPHCHCPPGRAVAVRGQLSLGLGMGRPAWGGFPPLREFGGCCMQGLPGGFNAVEGTAELGQGSLQG